MFRWTDIGSDERAVLDLQLCFNCLISIKINMNPIKQSVVTRLKIAGREWVYFSNVNDQLRSTEEEVKDKDANGVVEPVFLNEIEGGM